MYETSTIEQVAKGDLFKISPTARKTYSRQGFDRTSKKYECDDYDDISRSIKLPKGTTVYLTWDTEGE